MAFKNNMEYCLKLMTDENNILLGITKIKIIQKNSSYAIQEL